MSKKNLDRFAIKKVVGGARIVHTVEFGEDRYAIYSGDSPESLVGYEGEVFFSTLEEALEHATQMGLQNVAIVHAVEPDGGIDPADVEQIRMLLRQGLAAQRRGRLNRRRGGNQCNIL